MPNHNASRKPQAAPKSKSVSAASGSEKKRSQVTGRKLGRAAERAIGKNASHSADYLEKLEAVTSIEDLQALIAESYKVARVTRQLGHGRLQVTLQTGETEVTVLISGTLRFKGSSGADSKKELDHCMRTGDLVLIDGGYASTRFTLAEAADICTVFNAHELRTPRDFFAVVEDDEDDGFAWDRSDEKAATAKAADARKADALRRTQIRGGGAKMARKSYASNAVVEEMDARAAVAAEFASRLEEEEDDDEDTDNSAASAVGGAGPTRAERRAAAVKAAAEAAAEAEMAAAAARKAWAASVAEAEATEFVPEPLSCDDWESLIDGI